MPAEVVVDVVVVPVVLPQLRVLGVLGGRVPVVLRELLKFIILLVDLVVGLALLGGLRVLRGERGGRESVRRVDVASSMRGRARVSFRAASNRRFLRVRLGRVGLGLVAHGNVLCWSSAGQGGVLTR